jgi:hypothetical protein
MISSGLKPMSFFVWLVLTHPDEWLCRVSTFSRAGSRSRHLFGASGAPLTTINGHLRDCKVRNSHRRRLALSRVWVPRRVETCHGANSSEGN